MGAARRDDEARREHRAACREVAALFLKLGVVGFGGPAAHIAMMREEVVARRGWVDDAELVELIGATNLIPGPNSTELAIHLGHRRAGTAGLVLAGVCFITPAVLTVSVLAWLYAAHGTSPAAFDLRYGILPVILAIVVQALVGLARTTVVDVAHGVLAVAAGAAWLAGAPELPVLVVCGLAMVAWRARHRLAQRLRRPPGALLGAVPVLAAASAWRLFLVFLEIGSVLYGSGYVLLAFLQRALVDDRGWLTTTQLLDAIAVGQITPGPVFTTATFVGWQVDGLAGAAAATLGIFLPSFVFVALLGRLVPWMRTRPAAHAFLRGVTAASLGLMAAVLVDLADAALVDAVTALAALAGLAVLLRWRPNPAWLVAAGALLAGAHALVT